MSMNQISTKSVSERMELYRGEHPRSPSAVYQPRIFFKSGTWVALLGENVESGIAGFGSSIEAALRAFDFEYRNSPQPAAENGG